MPEDKVIPVRVALRCRPLINREVAEGCQVCLQFVEGEPQVILGTDRAFTYDHVFGPDTSQKYVYESTVSRLVEGLFKGYNATVLAYGQTGSGKTFSMGGAYGLGPDEDEDIVGIIPRVIRDLFSGIKEKQDEHVFNVKVSYLEIYKEELLDLLVPASKREKDAVAIREDVNGGIKITGLKERTVQDEDDTMKCLEDGSQGRTTGATAMNSTSSRSHAIFTIYVDRTSKKDSQDCCKAKFHLVDLAGSERQKKTRAEGNRFKEGVNINMGLLALGNVISALGDEAQKRTHIPYRDSKLTRLLQDSLGGNSHTVMIACVSPADSNMEETLSTMRYADRARKIKNKPVVNRDPQAAEILRLRGMVQQLQMQLMANGGTIGSLGNTPNTSFEQIDIKALKERIKELEEENNKLVNQIQNLFDQNANLVQRMISIEAAKDKYKESLEEFKAKTELLSDKLNMMNQNSTDENESLAEQTKIFQELQSIVEDLNNENDDLETIPEEDENVETSVSNESQSSSQMSSPEKRSGERKAQLHNELMQLNDQLTKKEEFVKLLVKNEENFTKQRREEDEEKLKAEIDKLQKQLDEANQQIRSSSANAASSKLSEQRRQKVKELEAQLAEHKRRLVDYSKVKKMSEQMEKDLTRVKSEILALKQTRVKLMKQIKEETEHFRKFRQQKEKEVTQLKAKDRRREVEFVKMERQHERQQAVLRRKAEQAAAANKRLKEALAKQQGVAEERAKAQERQAGTMQERIRKLINTEYELASSIEEARRHRESLIEDRKTISEKLNKLRTQLEAPPSKRRTLNNSQPGDSEEQETLRKQIKQLEAEIELRNASIQDLSEKLMKADQDDKSKFRWNSIHSVVESKVALAHLLSKAVKSRAHAADMTSKMEEMRVEVEEANQAAETAEKDLKTAKHHYDVELSEVKRNHEKRVLLILNQWNQTSDDSVKDRLRIQMEELQKMGDLHDELIKKDEELKNARQLLTKASYTKGNMSLMPDFDTPREKLFVTPKEKRTKKVSRKRKSEDVDSDEFEDFEDEEDEEEEPEFDDVDWKPGFTPGFNAAAVRARRTKQFSRSEFDLNNSEEIDESAAVENEAQPVRLSSTLDEEEDTSTAVVSCKCKGECGTKRCMCKKAGSSCKDNCKCRSEKCSNREPELPQSTTDDAELEKNQENTMDSLNSTFTMNKAVVDTSFEDSASTDTSRSVLSERNNVPKHAPKRHSDKTLPQISEDDTVEKGGVKKRRLKRPGKQFFTNPV